jgi:hypothetical protein
MSCDTNNQPPLIYDLVGFYNNDWKVGLGSAAAPAIGKPLSIYLQTLAGGTGKVTFYDGAGQPYTLPTSGGGAGGPTNITATVTGINITIANSNGTGFILNAATGTNSGLMTAADKVKLDAIVPHVAAIELMNAFGVTSLGFIHTTTAM